MARQPWLALMTGVIVIVGAWLALAAIALLGNRSLFVLLLLVATALAVAVGLAALVAARQWRSPRPAAAERDAIVLTVPAAPPAMTAPDDLLANGPWIRLVEECVELFDELDQVSPRLEPPARELAEHMQLRLQQILERANVAVIIDETAFDRSRHQPEQKTSVAPGAALAATVSPGFVVGRRVLRRARVSVAGGGD